MIQSETYLNVADNSGAKALMHTCARGIQETLCWFGRSDRAVVKDALPPSAARKGAGVVAVKKAMW